MLVPRSIRLRLTLWYVLILAVLLAAFSTGVYFVLRNNLYDNLDDSLRNRAITYSEVLSEADGQPTLTGRISSGDPNAGESFVRVFDLSGSVTFDDSTAAGTAPLDPLAVSRSLEGETSVRTVTVADESMRVRTLPFRSGGSIAGALEVGQSEGDVTDTLQALLLILAAAYPVALGLATVGGVFLASRALAPIDRLTLLARRISAEDLSERLDMDLPDDEVGRLSRTFNEMIARLDDAFRRQRQFTADASHELRTPLTVLKGQIEVASQRERNPEAYREVLRATGEEVDHMIRLVGSLLTLARADAGQIPMAREAVDLGGLVDAAVAQVRPSAEQNGLMLTIERGPRTILEADEDLLLQLLLNLLDNAVKYTPSGGGVNVGWTTHSGRAVLRVSNTGPGIPNEHLSHIFDRFYRVDQARSRSQGGAGLGLSICRWIAEAHGGAISAESPSGDGTVFSVTLPLSGP